MRQTMEEIIKEELKNLALKRRWELGISQSKMAEALLMAPRSYADIEYGESMCGTLTAVLLLLDLEDSKVFLMSLKARLIEVYSSLEVII